MTLPIWIVPLLCSVVLAAWALHKAKPTADYDFGALFYVPLAVVLFLIPWLIYFIIF